MESMGIVICYHNELRRSAYFQAVHILAEVLPLLKVDFSNQRVGYQGRRTNESVRMGQCSRQKEQNLGLSKKIKFT